MKVISNVGQVTLSTLRVLGRPAKGGQLGLPVPSQPGSLLSSRQLPGVAHHLASTWPSFPPASAPLSSVASRVGPQQGFGCPPPPALSTLSTSWSLALSIPLPRIPFPLSLPSKPFQLPFMSSSKFPLPPRGEGAEGPFSNFPRTLCLSLQLAETLITLQNGQLLLVGHWGKWGGVGGGTCLALPSIPRLGPLPGFLVTALEVTQVFPIEADLGWWPRSGVLCGPRESPGWGTRERAHWGSGPAHF